MTSTQPDLIDTAAYDARLAALPEPELRRLTDYMMAAITALRVGRYDHRIIPVILEGHVLHGRAVLPSNTLAKRIGTTRETVCKARRRIEAAGFIRRIGMTGERQPIYMLCLERADEYRARADAIDLQFADELRDYADAA